jgi:hypothetical protein
MMRNRHSASAARREVDSGAADKLSKCCGEAVELAGEPTAWRDARAARLGAGAPASNLSQTK